MNHTVTKNKEYIILLSKVALKDKLKLENAKLGIIADKILDLMKDDPFCYPPPYEKLVGDLKNYYSRRINRQHRLLYRVDEKTKTIYVLRMWTHYE